jgi:hypothetical protein
MSWSLYFKFKRPESLQAAFLLQTVAIYNNIWWCPACNDAISQIFISFQCLALIFVVTEKLAQDVDKKWFFEKGVVTCRALPNIFKMNELKIPESVYRRIAFSQGGLGIPGFLKRYAYARINTLKFQL